MNNGCVHRREFSDFSKIFSSQGSYNVPFPQNKYFVKLIKLNIVLFQATIAFLGIVVLLTHRQVNTSQNALDLLVSWFCFSGLNDQLCILIQVRFCFWLFSLVTHILHNTLETFYIVIHEYQICRFTKFNLKKGAFGWFNYKTSVHGSDDGALERKSL